MTAGMPVLSAHKLIHILERAVFLLLRKSKESHSLPNMIFGNRPNMHGLLAEASHAIEMYRRRIPNEKNRRVLARLVNCSERTSP
jgi:hypothetical protein